MKKKALIILLSASLAVSGLVTGCGSEDKKDAASSKPDTSSESGQDSSSGSDAADSGETAQPEAGTDADAAGEENPDAQTPETETPETDASETPETETAEENTEKKEEKVVMYTTVNLILRKKGNMDAEKIDILPINTKVTVLKKGKEWYKVKANGKKGFVFAEYLTKSKEEAATLAAEAEAQAAAEAAAQAAAQNSYTAPQNSGSSSGGGKTEVSREDYPDCDGSGHGYSEIHYSDGSTEIVEY